MNAVQFRLVVPDSAAELQATREIFREYAASLDVDLCFQGFEAELADLPGEYAEPEGALLLAFADEQLAGCVAMRRLVNVRARWHPAR